MMVHDLSPGFQKVKNHFSLISSKWRFFFLFVTISWANIILQCLPFFSFLFNSVLFILICRICREINKYNCLTSLLDIFFKQQGQDGMKFCSVGTPNLEIESEQTYVRRVAKRHSTCLGRSMNDYIAAEIRQTQISTMEWYWKGSQI